MTDAPALSPASIDELQQVVAASMPAPMRVAGAGTKARTTAGDAAQVLDLRRLSGIISYNPAECVFTALAGTPVADIDGALAAHSQYLPFDPTHLRAGGTITAPWRLVSVVLAVIATAACATSSSARASWMATGASLPAAARS